MPRKDFHLGYLQNSSLAVAVGLLVFVLVYGFAASPALDGLVEYFMTRLVGR